MLEPGDRHVTSQAPIATSFGEVPRWWRFTFWAICIYLILLSSIGVGFWLPNPFEGLRDHTFHYPSGSSGILRTVVEWLFRYMVTIFLVVAASHLLALWLVWRIAVHARGIRAASIYAVFVIGGLAFYVGIIQHLALTMYEIAAPDRYNRIFVLIPDPLAQITLVTGLLLSVPSWLILIGALFFPTVPPEKRGFPVL